MPDHDLTALRAKAEAAKAECGGLEWWVNGKLSIRAGASRYIAKAHWDGSAAAQHIVAAQPSVVLALLDRVEKAEDGTHDLWRHLEAERTNAASSRAEIARLRSLLARAGEALRPFASGLIFDADYSAARSIAREIEETLR